MTREKRVAGKIVLVTGGAMGIGRACAELLAWQGASVIITDIADPEGEAVVAAIKAEGGSANYLHHDVTDEATWRSVLKTIKDQFAALHILVNNAGIAIAAPLTEMSLADFQKQNAINLDGVFLGLKHCIPLIDASGGGSIINLSSVAGLKAAPGLAAYAMTKGGVRLLSKSAAIECANASSQVRVNSVHPGIIDTAIWGKMGLPSEGRNRLETAEIAANAVPGGRLGQPQDIAHGVLFLAADESSYVNGSELVIDHGFSA